MNATFIVDSRALEKYYENRDCHWQPLTLISDEIFEYIERAGNKQSKLERFAAYSLLFSMSEKIFGVRIKSLGRNEFGKPFIKELTKIGGKIAVSQDENPLKKISFSISHSGGFSAVTLSDEGECGVDIQVLPGRKTSERVEERFLRGISFDGEIGEFSFGEKGLSDDSLAPMEHMKKCSSLLRV